MHAPLLTQVEPAASQEATAEEPTTSETPQLMPQVLRRHASWGTSQASTESEASSSDVQLRRQPQCEQTSRRRGPAASLANKASLKQQSTQALRRDTQESDDTAEADAASKASTARAAAGGSGGLKPAAMPASLSAHFIGRMAQLFDSMFSGTAGGDERAGPNTAADADVAPGTPRLNSRDLPAQESGEAAAAAACADAQGSSRQRCTTWFSGVAQDV